MNEVNNYLIQIVYLIAKVDVRHVSLPLRVVLEYRDQAPKHKKGQQHPDKRPKQRGQRPKDVCELLVYGVHVNIK